MDWCFLSQWCSSLSRLNFFFYTPWLPVSLLYLSVSTGVSFGWLCIRVFLCWSWLLMSISKCYSQIQASIAQISQRQSEALNKRRKLNKELITTSTPRGSRNYQNAYSRRRRNSQTTELHQSDHNESEDDPGHKSPTDEHGTQIKPRRRNRRTETPSNQAYPSPSAISPENGCRENSTERIRENQDDSSGHVVPVLKPETFTWGRGGVRSHVRHGSTSSSRNVRANRLSKLTNYLKSGQRNECQV